MNQRPRPARSEARTPGPATLVIFGATGDLTHRKLLPALYNLAHEGLLHEDTRVIGFARRDWSDGKFREEMRGGVEEHSRRPVEDAVWEKLCGDLAYVRGSFDDAGAYDDLVRRLEAIAAERDGGGGTLFYYATPPSAYAGITERLGAAGLVGGNSGPWSRVIVEKPFGHDRDSARELDRALHRHLDEDQIFRIDHYLGKETVQNLLVFRLDNGIFEPLWNRRYVDHVQICVSESVGVGSRAGYYDDAGVVRDMLQNHLLQLLTLVAMEPPVRFDAKSVRDEKVKVLRAIRDLPPEVWHDRVVRAQYESAEVDGETVPGYLEAEGVAANSKTETFLAARLDIDTWRWGGTPFYIRSGKRLAKRATEIAIVFRKPPYELFPMPGRTPSANVLRLRMQPDEGISLSFESKVPGQVLDIKDVRMDFSYDEAFGKESPEAYERLILEAVLGDSTLFAREDEVDLSWKLVDRIVASWSQGQPPRVSEYPAGSWGPVEADVLIARDGRKWLNP